MIARKAPYENRIASESLRRGWNWHAYGSGFTRGRETKIVNSERDVFDHVGLSFADPAERFAHAL